MAAICRKRAEQERARSDRWIGERDVGRGQPRRPLEQRPAQGLIDEVDHRFDDFRRRVVGAGELAQPVVVDLEEMLIEIEPCLRLVLAERRPVHFVEDAGQRAERGFQRLLVGFVLGQEVERRADQRVRFSQLDRRQLDAVLEGNVEGARHEKAESHGLRIAVGELRRRVASGNRSFRQSSFRRCRLPWPAAISSRTSSRNRRQRRALVCASALALVGGCGVQVRKSATSARNVSGAFSFAPDVSMSPSSRTILPRVRRCAKG